MASIGPSGPWCQGLCRRVASLRSGGGGRPSKRRGASMIKPLQPPLRAKGKHANHAFGVLEMHPYPRLRRYFPRRGKYRRQKGCISDGRQPGLPVFQRPLGRLSGFYHKRRLTQIKWHPPTAAYGGIRLLPQEGAGRSPEDRSERPDAPILRRLRRHPLPREGGYKLRRSRHLPLERSEHNPSTQPAAAGGPTCAVRRAPFLLRRSRHYNPLNPLNPLNLLNPHAQRACP